MIRKAWWLVAAAVTLGCGEIEKTELRPSNLKADLETLATARIFFGHQSVGYNVLEGVTALAAQNGIALRIVEASNGPADDAPVIAHTSVGKNREPQTKCDAFGRILTSGSPVRWDAAILKFCYADLGEGTDRNPDRLMQYYKRTVASIREARPDLLLVHATLPLQSDGLGKRDAIKKLLGFGTSNDDDNVIRNRFNDLVRGEFPQDPMFDVAWAESTRPDGTRSGFTRNEQTIFTLAPEFTYDEGHLTPAGREWVAREFVRALASALRERSKTQVHRGTTS